MGLNIGAVIRRFTRAASGHQVPLRLTNIESLAVAKVEPDFAELARAGRLFHGGNQIIANGIAPVTAIPTTTATLALYNAEAAGGASYLIHRLGFWLGSGTPTAGATLLATVSPAPIASPPTGNGTGYGSASSSGSSRTTRSRWTTAVTLPTSPTSPAWMPVQSTFQLAAANVGQGDGWAELKGMLLVPPGYCLGLAILSGTGTTPLYGVGASWAELELDLE